MGRNEVATKLRKLASIITDVKIDVSLLLPFTNQLFANIEEELREVIKNNQKAKILLDRINEIHKKI